MRPLPWLPTPRSMKLTVLGAGAIGTAVAHDLCRREGVTRVQVCEARPIVLRHLRAHGAHPLLRTFAADARDSATLEPILSGSTVVVSCVGPRHSPALAQMAIEAGAHFVDLGGPLNDPELEERAAARGRWIVTGAGLAPGLANILVVKALEAFDRATKVRVLVGDIPAEPSPPFNHRLAHSAEKLLDDYTSPVTVLRDGRVETREPLTTIEHVEVEGFGTLEAFYAGAGLGALAGRLAGSLDRLSVKVLRYPGHAAQVRFLLDLGLADSTVLDVRTHLTYRDVLVRRLRQRLGGDYEDAVILRVDAWGVKNEAPVGLSVRLVDRFDQATGLSAMQRCTAFPAASAAWTLAMGDLTGGGHGALETVVPVDGLLADLADRGITVGYHEAEPLPA
ncbi:MAG: saccharopine dehydrogenase C-terminal domain-containing protein [Bacteroidota bacterium]